MSERIEFYKNRSIGDRFSVAIDFLKQNWKALYKNILIGGLPLAIIMSYLTIQLSGMRPVNANDLHRILLFYVVPLFLIFFITNIYLYSMTGAVLFHYDRNQLTGTTGWKDLKDTFFRFAGKSALITLLIAAFFIVIIVIFAVILGFTVSFSLNEMNKEFFIVLFLFFFLLFGGLIALAPSLSMQYFPAYFSGKTSVESIITGLVLGFKNWGSLFVALLLTGIVWIVIYLVFFWLRKEAISLLHVQLSIISYIYSTLSAIVTLLTTPIVVVIFAFQYFSIVEIEEGVSLQSRMDEFENL